MTNTFYPYLSILQHSNIIQNSYLSNKLYKLSQFLLNIDTYHSLMEEVQLPNSAQSKDISHRLQINFTLDLRKHTSYCFHRHQMFSILLLLQLIKSTFPDNSTILYSNHHCEDKASTIQIQCKCCFSKLGFQSCKLSYLKSLFDISSLSIKV